MNWKKWKMGLLISMLSGLFTGIVGLAMELTWQQTLMFVAMAVAKDGQLYLAKHPVENLSDTDPRAFTKPPDT